MIRAYRGTPLHSYQIQKLIIIKWTPIRFLIAKLQNTWAKPNYSFDSFHKLYLINPLHSNTRTQTHTIYMCVRACVKSLYLDPKKKKSNEAKRKVRLAWEIQGRSMSTLCRFRPANTHDERSNSKAEMVKAMEEEEE